MSESDSILYTDVSADTVPATATAEAAAPTKQQPRTASGGSRNVQGIPKTILDLTKHAPTI